MSSDLPIPDLDLNDVDPYLGIDVDLSQVQTFFPPEKDARPRRLLRPVPGEPNNYVLEIDNSSLELFSVCHKAAFHYLILAREASSPASALSFGTAIHKALDIRMRYGLTAATEQMMFQEVVNHYAKHPIPHDEWRNVDRAINELKRYNKKFKEPEAFEVCVDENDEPMVEMPFNFPFMTVEMNKQVPFAPNQIVDLSDASGLTVDYNLGIPPTYINRIYVIWTGRIDAIVRLDKHIWILDHKTNSRGGVQFYDDFIIANQMRGYTWAAHQLTGLPIAGLLLNSLTIRPPTEKSATSDFQRRQYFYRQDQIDEWVKDTQNLILNFLHALGQGQFPQETKWCHGKYGRCQYLPVCTIPADQRNELLSSHAYRDVTWSPLLVRS